MKTPRKAERADPSFRVSRVVRWGDCDPAGVVYAARYPEYVIDAVIAFLAEAGYGVGARGAAAEAVDLPCKHMGLTFHASLRPLDVIEIGVGVGEIRDHTFDLWVEARLSDGRVGFEAIFTPICVDSERRRVRLPAGLREVLALRHARGISERERTPRLANRDGAGDIVRGRRRKST